MEYQIWARGNTEKDFSKIQARLEEFLSKIGEVNEVRVQTAMPDNATYLTRAIAWGFVENYIKPEQLINRVMLAEVLGASEATAQKCLKELANLGVIYKGPLEYRKHPEPKRTLAEWLTDHPLWEGKWQPKYWTFDHGVHTKEVFMLPLYEPIRQLRHSRAGANIESLEHPLLLQLEENGCCTTTELAQALEINRSSAHRTLTRFLDIGLVELDQTEKANLWTVSGHYKTLRMKR